MFVTVVVVSIVLIVCRTVEDKAVVVPMVLSAKSVVDVVEICTVSVVVDVPLHPVSHICSATMAPMETNADSARKKL